MSTIISKDINPDELPRRETRAGWSRILNISPITIKKHDETGYLTGALHLNGRYRVYTREAILEWLDFLQRQ